MQSIQPRYKSKCKSSIYVHAIAAVAAATTEAASSSAEGKTPSEEADIKEYEPAIEATCLD